MKYTKEHITEGFRFSISSIIYKCSNITSTFCKLENDTSGELVSITYTINTIVEELNKGRWIEVKKGTNNTYKLF